VSIRRLGRSKTAAFALGGLVLLAACDRRQLIREAALRTNLRTLRDVIGQFHEDHGRHPTSLEQLVDERYLRRIPDDPLTRRADTWILDRDADPPLGVVNVRSGADGEGSDGRPYASW
jgi:general secretion pathway protein G